MKRIIVALVVTLLASVVLLARHTAAAQPAAPSFDDQRDAVAAAVDWLVDNQNADGGYGIDFGTGEPLSSVASTVDAVLAISSAGMDPAMPQAGSDATPISYLASNVDGMMAYTAVSGGPTGKLIMALAAANQNARDFAGEDWVALLQNQYDTDTGSFGAADGFNQALAMLGLAAVNEPVPAAAVTFLTDAQAEDGSWDDGFGTLQNPDTTALAIMALLSADVAPDDTAVVDAVAFLASAQLSTGGWEYGVGFGENANSTAFVVQALSALGEDFTASDGPWAKEGVAPLDALFSYQNTTGAFQFFGADDFFATVQSIPAATGRPLPLPSRYEAAREATMCLTTLQDAETGGWEQFATFGVNAAGTARAIEAIGAFGDNPQSDRWTPGDVNAVEALEAMTPDYLSSGRGGRVGTVMQGVLAAGAPYTVDAFAELDLPAVMATHLAEDGTYADTGFGPYSHAEAMLGLLSADLPVAPESITALQSLQTDGDYGGADGNGIAINVLGRLGMVTPDTMSALADTQLADGGWGFAETASPSSTSEVVQGLVQQGENPFGPAWSVVVDGQLQSPADAVLAQQGSDGCWPNQFGPGNDPFGTTDAILLLMSSPETADAGAMVYLPAVLVK